MVCLKTRAMWLFMLNMAFKNLRVLDGSSFVIRVKKNSLKPRIYRRYGACWCFNWSVIWQLMLLEVLAKN